MYYTKLELHDRRRRRYSLAQQYQQQQQNARNPWRLINLGITLRVFLATTVGLMLVVLQLHVHFQNLIVPEEVPPSRDLPQLNEERHVRQTNNVTAKLASPQNGKLVKVSSLFGMNRVDRSKRLEFLHITKTGGSAIEMGAAAAGVQWGACHYLEVPYLGCNQTTDLVDPLDLDMPEELINKTHSEPWHSPPHWLVPNPHPKDKVVNFVVVRDPYQRIFSEFYCSSFGYNGTVTPKALNAWITEKLLEDTPYYGHLLPQHYYVFHHKTGARLVDHVLRYETLAKEFELLMKLYHLKVQLPQRTSAQFYMIVDQTASRLTVTDLSDDTLRLINEYYRLDFETFGYGMIVTE